ncbi:MULTISPECIES: hypothetical protein [Sphingomonadaceae]|uniref:Secreted protein n=1 Tax=Sphingomonas bisphenolicum TaxID=296544 RepID=A0ABM7FZ82_9SPHN|nr:MULTISPECIES: hypothetical protein [Sphingomonadaceae]MBZ9647960.1 hypothetical protein [Sphingobium sp. 3R8]BBF69044.1 hypothetical protein SBA_ch1_12440 [Sphingomonas bisphenolicum]
MRRTTNTALTAALLAGCIALAGCGDKEQGGNKVQMKDMEVVDGTATDAMTDLDGVQSEGTAIALPSGNAAENSSMPAKAVAEKAPAEDAEVLSDQ